MKEKSLHFYSEVVPWLVETGFCWRVKRCLSKTLFLFHVTDLLPLSHIVVFQLFFLVQTAATIFKLSWWFLINSEKSQFQKFGVFYVVNQIWVYVIWKCPFFYWHFLQYHHFSVRQKAIRQFIGQPVRLITQNATDRSEIYNKCLSCSSSPFIFFNTLSKHLLYWCKVTTSVLWRILLFWPLLERMPKVAQTQWEEKFCTVSRFVLNVLRCQWDQHLGVFVRGTVHW